MWYEEYDRATSKEDWWMESSSETRERVTAGDSHKVSFDWDLIEKGLEQGLITTSVGDSALWVTIGGIEFIAQEQGEFYVDKTDDDVSRDDVINSILDTFELIRREPNDRASVKLAACVAYLNKHVGPSREGAGLSLKGEAETMRSSANQLAGGEASSRPSHER